MGGAAADMAALDPVDSSLSGHVIVCGLGHVGYRIVCLLGRLGERGVVITRGANEDWRAETEARFPVIIGDARNDALLRQAGVERARAILIVTDDDLTNISIAIDARRLNPGLIVVARMFDQDLGAHLEQAKTIDRALSASALAAPVFVAASLGEMVLGEFEWRGLAGRIEAQSAEEADAGTVGEWGTRHTSAVVAIERDGRTTLNPGRSAAIRSADKLTTLRFAGQVRRKASRRAGDSSAGRALRMGLREWWQSVPGSLRLVLAALLGVVALSVLVFHCALKLSLVDSLYFVITTVTTVGYGDYNLMNASPGMKLFGVLVMLSGAAIMATLFSIVTDFIIGLRLRDLLARGFAQFEGHFVVAGLGGIGFRLARELVRNGEIVVAIEQREDGEFVQAARELGPVIQGNAKTVESLRKAGVGGAKALIAATDDDLANLGIGLAAKRANPACRVVVRIFDSTLAAKMQQGLGVESILSASEACAPMFVGSVLCPDVLQGVLLPDGLVLIFRRITSGPGGCDAQLQESEFPLFVKRPGEQRPLLVDPGMRFEAGDEIIGARWHPFPQETPAP